MKFRYYQIQILNLKKNKNLYLVKIKYLIILMNYVLIYKSKFNIYKILYRMININLFIIQKLINFYLIKKMKNF